MNVILHDFDQHLTFAPLTLTRPVGELRMGIYTNTERWKVLCPEAQVSFKTEGYLAEVFPENLSDDNYFVNASVIASPELVAEIKALEFGTSLFAKDVFIASRGKDSWQQSNVVEVETEKFVVLKERWNLFQLNDEVLRMDFTLATKNKQSAPLSKTCQLIGDTADLFIAPSAKVEGAILNTTTGPIYIGEHAEIMEGSVVRGGLALCEHAVLKLASKIYGATTIGPYCKVGGEVNNVIFQAYSNKGHDGFLGNSLIGAWCNLGADTNTSNLKNNYGLVKTYDYRKGHIVQTDVQFMGVTMGDHSKTGINTMLNTATVVGVSATIFGAPFPPKFIPSFAWGGFDEVRFNFGKAVEASNNMMVRRGLALSDAEKEVFRELFRAS